MSSPQNASDPTASDATPAYFRDAIDRLLSGEASSKEDVQALKRELAREHPVDRVPKDAEILERCGPEEREALVPLLRTTATRSLSGVAVVTVQASPWGCPHGTCSFCPGGPGWGTAQSYTGEEPAALRAERHGFDARDQARDRLEGLHATGHAVDKVDVIVQGGTFPARPLAYQESFLRGIFDALNGYDRPGYEAPGSLGEAQAFNEAEALARCVGLTIETKPDWAGPVTVDRLLRFGATRVELGVQTVHEAELEATNRGHGVQESIDATRWLRDAGLKVCHHLMPGLPGSSYESDLETFRTVFEDPAWRPDKLKVYPTLVVPDTELFAQWERGEFEPVTEDYCIRLLREAKRRFVPPWVRIQRIERDIPTFMVDAGVQKTNLRQLVRHEMVEAGERCRCIRCREAGHRERKDGVVARGEDVELTRTAYEAGGGREHFLAFEDVARDVLVAYLRLRVPPRDAYEDLPNREHVSYPDHLVDAALVRELRTVGSEVPLGERGEGDVAWQHEGFGRRLMDAAEELAVEEGASRVAVTSGVGVRGYYREKLGYARSGPYMVKDL